MAYCTQQDILGQVSEKQLISLTDDNNVTVNSSVVSQAIDNADSEIDGWIGKRYSLPLSSLPGVVKKMSADIAIYNLYTRRRGAPDDRKDRYNNAITFLKAVAKGSATLGENDPSGVPQSQVVEITSNTRLFNRTDLEGF